jgi:hypothetical protein
MDDGEYVKIVKNKKSTRNTSIIFICIASTLIGASIFIRVRASKKVLEDGQDGSNTNSSNNGDRRCRFCDRFLDEDETYCKDCGAKVR